MNHHFDDITSKLGAPMWWDSLGYPRYCKFKPDKTSNIYACVVCLVELACQGCDDTFDVAINYGTYELYIDRVAKEIYGKIKERSELEGWLFRETSADMFKHMSKEDWIAMFRYGDPPYHDNGEHSCIGCTMGSYSLRIKECWIQDKYIDWKRHSEYEIELETKE